MKTIYLHIGKPKTGTTTIQNFLALNGDLLKENNFYYPCDNERSYIHDFQHVPLTCAISKKPIWQVVRKKPDMSDKLFEDLQEDVNKANCDNVIISSEYFSHVVTFSRDNIRTLKQKLDFYFPEYKVKIIIYIRRQDDYFVSGISEGLKYGNNGEISLENAYKYASFRTYELLEVYAEQFGAENITARPFDRVQFVDNDLLADFLDVIGISFDKNYEIPTMMNESLTLQEMNFFEKLNKLMETAENNDIHQRIRQYIRDTKIFCNGKSKNALSEDDKEKLVQFYREENENVEKLLGMEKPLFRKFEKSNSDEHEKYKIDDQKFKKMMVELIEDLFIKNERNEKNLINTFKNLDKFVKNEKIDIKYLKDNNFFDEEYYLLNNLDVKDAKMDPIVHYVKWGWRENRKPCKDFDTYDFILQNYEETINQESNPFVYYCKNK